MRSHRSFDFILCRFEFFLQCVPIVVFGKLIDAAAASKNVLADAESLRQFDYVRAGIFDLLSVARLDRDETIGNETAEVERNLRAVTVSHRDRRTILTWPVYFCRFRKSRE